jgi:hypothetical protein
MTSRLSTTTSSNTSSFFRLQRGRDKDGGAPLARASVCSRS